MASNSYGLSGEHYHDNDVYDPNEAFQDSSPFRDARGVRIAAAKGDLARVGKGVLAGAIAGLAAGAVMNLFQMAWTSGEKKLQEKGAIAKPKQQEAHKADATVRTAQAIADVAGHKLTKKEEKAAGPAVHYIFSAIMGGLYGGLAEVMPVSKTGFGLPFGTALFIGADEIAIPALGLGAKPQDTELSKHIYGWLSHLVWGAVTEGGRRGLLAGFDHM